MAAWNEHTDTGREPRDSRGWAVRTVLGKHLSLRFAERCSVLTFRFWLFTAAGQEQSGQSPSPCPSRSLGIRPLGQPNLSPKVTPVPTVGEQTLL